jgi:hypothetical protein
MKKSVCTADIDKCTEIRDVLNNAFHYIACLDAL